MNVVVMACGSPVKKKSPFWEERAIEGVHGCPLIFQIFCRSWHHPLARWLSRFHRADPSTSLDKSADWGYWFVSG
jgi:hypothetical protein